MVRYSFLVGLFHPQLHAGLSRRLRSLTVAARNTLAQRGHWIDPRIFSQTRKQAVVQLTRSTARSRLVRRLAVRPKWLIDVEAVALVT